MGDRKSNQLEVSEKAVGSISSTATRKLFKIGSKRGKLPSPRFVPIKGIHTGNIVSVKGVQDVDGALKPNSTSSEGGKVSWNRRLIESHNEEIRFLNKERKQLNKKVSNWKSDNSLS